VFPREEIAGRYYVINQGTAINARIAEPFILYLREDGTVGGESVSGSWSLSDGSVFLHLTLDDASWSGIICRMQDDAGTDVTVFSLAGQNESVWGVRYDEQETEKRSGTRPAIPGSHRGVFCLVAGHVHAHLTLCPECLGSKVHGSGVMEPSSHRCFIRCLPGRHDPAWPPLIPSAERSLLL
jgi:hypothetical protein